jgi:predicted TIM-barrel fold metal-dependent hydrolase
MHLTEVRNGDLGDIHLERVHLYDPIYMQRRSDMPDIDLAHIPLVDNHCHGLYRDQYIADIVSYRRLFTESFDPAMPREHVATSVFYQRLVRALAAFLDCEPSEDAVLAARQAIPRDELIGRLLRAANIGALIVDQGYPSADVVLPDADVAHLGGCRTYPLLRLEVLMQRLLVEHATLDAVIDALRTELADLRGRGYVGLKSIAAYRTGLAIDRWEDDAVQASFAEARREVAEKGAIRLAHKPLLDTLLHVAFAEAARQELPVQFHVGYGDTDADLRLANPLHLRAVLEEPAYRGMPVVLLHECYPYTREGGYLAAVYGNVYLDLSYGIPFLSLGEMLAFTRAALGVAPLSKLLYSSDGVGVPELHWLSARDGRRVLGEALGELVVSGELTLAEGEQAGEAILRDNAVRLYGLQR